MYTIFIVVHVMIAVALIALVLLQQGRGAEAGAAFGSGASSTVFGARGAASFLTRLTAGLATGFFLTSLTLAYFATQSSAPESVVERLAAPQVEEDVAEQAPPVGPADVPALPQPAEQ